MNKHILSIGVLGLLLVGMLTSCTKDLNRNPSNTNTSDVQYSTVAGYKQVLAKVYGAYSLISSSGTGTSDVNVPNISGATLGAQAWILAPSTVGPDTQGSAESGPNLPLWTTPIALARWGASASPRALTVIESLVSRRGSTV